MASKVEYLGKSDLLIICQLVSTELNKYVKAVDGKGLSENDFTTALMNKLSGIADGAEVNVQSDWNQTSTSADDYIKNKPNMSEYAKIASPALTGTPTVPTAAAGTNTTQAASTAFVTTAVANAIQSITGITFQKVNSFADLPTTGSNGVIYLVPNSGSAPNVYDEYYWDSTTSKYELFGSTEVDLSNYVSFDDISEATEADVRAVWESVFGK